jgi:hypothetical protein
MNLLLLPFNAVIELRSFVSEFEYEPVVRDGAARYRFKNEGPYITKRDATIEIAVGYDHKSDDANTYIDRAELCKNGDPLLFIFTSCLWYAYSIEQLDRFDNGGRVFTHLIKGRMVANTEEICKGVELLNGRAGSLTC